MPDRARRAGWPARLGLVAAWLSATMMIRGVGACTYGARRVVGGDGDDSYVAVWAGDWTGDGRADVVAATAAAVVVYAQQDAPTNASGLAFARAATFVPPGASTITGLAVGRLGSDDDSEGVVAAVASTTAGGLYAMMMGSTNGTNVSVVAIAESSNDGTSVVVYDAVAVVGGAVVAATETRLDLYDAVPPLNSPAPPVITIDAAHGANALAATADGGLAAASTPDGALAYYAAPLGMTTTRHVITNELLGLRAVAALDATVASGSTLDDTVAVAQRLLSDDASSLFGPVVRATESAHGVISVALGDLDNAGPLDVVSACRDDATLRQHLASVTAYETEVVDAEAAGIAAVAVADLDADAAPDLVAAIDGVGVVYYLSDCAAWAPPSGSSKKKKKSKSGGGSTVAVVVIVVVAVLACGAGATFFLTSYPDAVQSVVDTLSFRRRRRRRPPPPPPPENGDDADDDRAPAYQVVNFAEGEKMNPGDDDDPTVPSRRDPPSPPKV